VRWLAISLIPQDAAILGQEVLIWEHPGGKATEMKPCKTQFEIRFNM
jgi:hypothetical protein